MIGFQQQEITCPKWLGTSFFHIQYLAQNFFISAFCYSNIILFSSFFFEVAKMHTICGLVVIFAFLQGMIEISLAPKILFFVLTFLVIAVCSISLIYFGMPHFFLLFINNFFLVRFLNYKYYYNNTTHSPTLIFLL